MNRRVAEIERETKETRIAVALTLEGARQVAVDTGMGFADHMLTLLAFWAGFDLRLTCKGDLEVDAHHSLEDIGICLGQALNKALGDKGSIARVGWARVPMDDALCDVCLDISGRPYLVYDDSILPQLIAGEERDVWREFFKSLAFNAKLNLHMRFLYGQNGHHLLESACKGLGLTLAQAVAPAAVQGGVLSTKGSLES